MNIIDGDNKCEAPSIEYVDGHLKFNSATSNATFLYTLACDDVKTSLENCENGDVPLSASYKVIAYAQAEGYDTSDPATATLHWIEPYLDNGDIPTQIIAPKRGILISTNDGFVTISGLEENEVVEAYTTDGKYITTTRAAGNAACITANVGDIIILKIAGESLKVNVR